MADSLRSLAEGEDLLDQSTPMPMISPDQSSMGGMGEAMRTGGLSGPGDESGMDDDIPVSRSLYATQPVTGYHDVSLFKEKREARISHTRRMVVILLFLFGVVIGLPALWGLLLLMGKTNYMADRAGAEAMARLLCIGGFSITAVMWIAAAFLGLQKTK